VCRWLGLPRISALVLLGVGIAVARDWSGLGGLTLRKTLLGPLEEPLVTVALVMVAFLLGGFCGTDHRYIDEIGRQCRDDRPAVVPDHTTRSGHRAPWPTFPGYPASIAVA